MVIFRKGAHVMLLGCGDVVGGGTLYKVRRDDMLHGVLLGDNRVAVLVEEDIDSDFDLPYPLKHANKMSEAREFFVLWDKEDVVVVEQDVTTSRNTSEQGGADAQLHMPGLQHCGDENVDLIIPDSQGVPNASFEDFVIERDIHAQEAPISLRPTDEGVDGDEVYLFISGCKVGRAIVHRVGAAMTCHSVLIGDGNISVRILEVEEAYKAKALPFPHAGAESLGDSIGIPCKWAVSDVQKVVGLQNNTEDTDGIHVEQRQPTHGDAKEKENLMREEVNYTKRRFWYMEEVKLYCQQREILVGEGIVSVALATGVVNDQELGVTNVGIVLMVVHQKDYFPNVGLGNLPTLAWPIHQVQLSNDGRFLGDIIKEAADDSDGETHIIEQRQNPQKRAYHSIKRKKLDLEAKRLKDMEKRKNNRLTETEIRKSRSTDCCRLECCHNTPLEEFHKLRSDYWLSSFTNRWTYMMSLFQNRPKDLIAQKMMLLKTRVVCKQGFYEIFGFSRTQFYKYDRAFQEGQNVGFHGNGGQVKTRVTTMLARAMLENMLKSTGEPMPHLTYNGGNGTDDIEYRLPASMTKMSIWLELNATLKTKNLPEIGHSTFHNTWNAHFANYKIHTSSAFSKCDECIEYKEALQRERRAKERAEIESLRATHLRQQMSRRHVYYGARIRSKRDPDNHLCIIHDKMDQNKTWLPRMANHPKSLSTKSNPLPISLTGMITHGRDPGSFAHYGLTGLWAGDPDFTVTSITMCLRDLEEYRGDKSGHLGSVDVPENCHAIFRQLLDQNAFVAAYLIPKGITVERFQGLNDGIENIPISLPNQDNEQAPNEASSSSSFKPLPKHLVLQMDNSAKDNKNQTMLAFSSDLVARGIFETVTMSFLMKGHTHEDIDAAFSKVSLRTRGKDIGTLPELMAEVWECMQDMHMVPKLISEVAAYKAYLKSYKVKQIVGQSAPVAFHFSMKNNKPVYQWKSSITEPWMPEDGKCIWASDPITKKLIVPVDDPCSKNMRSTYEKSHEVVPYLKKYIDHHLKGCTDQTSEAYRIKAPLIQYWQNVVDSLEGQFGPDNASDFEDSEEDLPKLSYRFWPRTNHGTGYKLQPQSMEDHIQPTQDNNVEMEDLVRELAQEIQGRESIFVGRPSEREKQAWNPLEMIKDGSFVCLNPDPHWEIENGKGLFWVVKALGSVQPDIFVDGEKRPCFYGEWWRPKSTFTDPPEKMRYGKIFSTGQSWERDPGYSTPVWHKASSSMYSWVFHGKPENIQKNGLKVGKRVLENVREYIKRLDCDKGERKA